MVVSATLSSGKYDPLIQTTRHIDIRLLYQLPKTCTCHPQTVRKTLFATQHTQNICITFIQRRPNVFDIGPKLYKMLYKCFVCAGYRLPQTVFLLYSVSEDAFCLLFREQIVASELNDPICHSNECQIGSFSSVATRLATLWYFFTPIERWVFSIPIERQTRSNSTMRSETAATAYLKSKQFLLFSFARQRCMLVLRLGNLFFFSVAHLVLLWHCRDWLKMAHHHWRSGHPDDTASGQQGVSLVSHNQQTQETSFSGRIDFTRQNLTSKDIRFWCLKSSPAL